MNRKLGRVALERAMSKRGIASRTQANKLIVAGKVRVNGNIITNPLFQVNPDKAKFEIAGKQLSHLSKHFYL
jgi:16S rRNA U516 pseudouridylate synthase RsuA-like enzyme